MDNSLRGMVLPTCEILVNGQKRKLYGKKKNKVYLSNGDNFQLKFFNPLQERIGVQLNMNGQSVDNDLMVLNPGQDITIERFIGTNRKLTFSTYDIDVNNKDAIKAIEKNGILEVIFWNEKKPIFKKLNWDRFPSGGVPGPDDSGIGRGKNDPISELRYGANESTDSKFESSINVNPITINGNLILNGNLVNCNGNLITLSGSSIDNLKDAEDAENLTGSISTEYSETSGSSGTSGASGTSGTSGTSGLSGSEGESSDLMNDKLSETIETGRILGTVDDLVIDEVDVDIGSPIFEIIDNAPDGYSRGIVGSLNYGDRKMSRKKLDTGRIEKGGYSVQHFKPIEFDTGEPFYLIKFKILPTSLMPIKKKTLTQLLLKKSLKVKHL